MGLSVLLLIGGYQANKVQFGIDQLSDASSIEITHFITCYIFPFLLAPLSCSSVQNTLQFTLGCLSVTSIVLTFFKITGYCHFVGAGQLELV